MPHTAPLPVALVMSSFAPGGTEHQMIELARRLNPARWSVRVACLRADGEWRDRVAPHLPVACFPVASLRRPGALGHAAAFARWCRREGICLVQTTDMPSNMFALPAAALAGVAVRIGSRREINAGKPTPAILVQRAAYACAHRVVANSHAAANRLIDERVPARKIAIVANGLDIDRYATNRVRRILRRVAIVANLRQEKGHDVLIEAAAHVLKTFADARFAFIGDGPAGDALRAQAAAAGVAHAITFHGHCDDVAARLAAADIFALPSRSEAFPNALLEAMAAGLPSVASEVGGILELIEHGRNGLLAPAGDARALADRLSALMANPSLGAALGAAARRDVAGRYSFDRMVAAFDLLYRRELTKRGRESFPAEVPSQASPNAVVS